MIFGPAKDEWVKPPSFIGGGIGMAVGMPGEGKEKEGGSTDKTVTYFHFTYSTEFARLHELYSMIANSGDVNRLAIFLSQNPYHPEGAVD